MPRYLDVRVMPRYVDVRVMTGYIEVRVMTRYLDVRVMTRYVELRVRMHVLVRYSEVVEESIKLVPGHVGQGGTPQDDCVRECVRAHVCVRMLVRVCVCQLGVYGDAQLTCSRALWSA